VTYYCKIVMRDEYGNDVYKVSGEARKKLPLALNYLKNKEDRKIIQKVLEYLEEDFKVLNIKTRKFEKLLLGGKR